MLRSEKVTRAFIKHTPEHTLQHTLQQTLQHTQRSEEVKRALIQRLEREEGIMRYADFYNEDDTPRADRCVFLF